MTDWEARYKSVVSLVEPKHVEAAEALVKAAHDLALSTRLSTGEAVELMFHAAHKFKMADAKFDYATAVKEMSEFSRSLK